MKKTLNEIGCDLTQMFEKEKYADLTKKAEEDIRTLLLKFVEDLYAKTKSVWQFDPRDCPRIRAIMDLTESKRNVKITILNFEVLD